MVEIENTGEGRYSWKTPFIFIRLCEDLALLQATYVQKPLNSHKSKLDLIDFIRLTPEKSD